MCHETLNWFKGTADAYPKPPTQSHRMNSEIPYLLWCWPQAKVSWIFFSLYCSTIKVATNKQVGLWAASIMSITYIKGKTLTQLTDYQEQGSPIPVEEVLEYQDQGEGWLFLPRFTHRFGCTPLGVGSLFPSLEMFHVQCNFACGLTLHNERPGGRKNTSSLL